MISKVVLLNNLLFASAALAVLSSRPGGHRRENCQLQPIKCVDFNPDWSGAVLTEPAGTFTTATGTFTVPTPSDNTGVALSVWVGIDGFTCDNAFFQTGIELMISDGVITYDAWYEWYPDYAYDFSGIVISAGDVITATVTASSTTSGTATFTNATATGPSGIIYTPCDANPVCIEQNGEVLTSVSTSGETLTIQYI